MIPNGKKIIQNCIKDLKRTWGVPMSYLKFLSTTNDFTTGIASVKWQSYSIKKGIILPKIQALDSRLASLLKSLNSNFAQVPTSYADRKIIIDARDLGIIPDTKDRIVVDGLNYQINKDGIEMYEYEAAYLFTVRHVVGEAIGNIIEQSAESGVNTHVGVST